MVAAASLAGCGTSPRPFSLEERFWFDKAVGHDILPVNPEPYYLTPAYGARPYAPPGYGAPPYASPFYRW
jgi:hypothetical protein